MTPKTFEKPRGVRDFSPEYVHKQKEIQKRLDDLFTQWGYQEVMTPTLEYYDTVGKASAISSEQMWKCLDMEGNLLVLRPDQTAPIARMVSTVLREQAFPLRLFYHGWVYRKQEKEAGKHAELFQSGVELIGLAHPFADAEVILLAVEALKVLEIKPFCITLGHIALLEELLREYVPNLQQRLNLKRKLAQKDLAGFSREIKQVVVEHRKVNEILKLLRPYTEASLFQALRKQFSHPHVRKQIDHFQAVWEHLKDAGIEKNIILDLTLVGRLDYYTGIYFEGVTEGMGFPLFSGGRYDELHAYFGNPKPATGFAFQLDHVIEASPIQTKMSEIYLIQYTSSKRKEAWKKAIDLRRQGKRVVIEQWDGKEELVRGGFDHVIRIGGKSC